MVILVRFCADEQLRENVLGRDADGSFALCARPPPPAPAYTRARQRACPMARRPVGVGLQWPTRDEGWE